jgi:hypothetical protein
LLATDRSSPAHCPQHHSSKPPHALLPSLLSNPTHALSQPLHHSHHIFHNQTRPFERRPCHRLGKKNRRQQSPVKHPNTSRSSESTLLTRCDNTVSLRLSCCAHTIFIYTNIPAFQGTRRRQLLLATTKQSSTPPTNSKQKTPLSPARVVCNDPQRPCHCRSSMRNDSSNTPPLETKVFHSVHCDHTNRRHLTVVDNTHSNVTVTTQESSTTHTVTVAATAHNSSHKHTR